MKQLIDQNGKIVKFGDLIHYSESVSKKDYKSFFDVHVTLTPENIEKLKAIGAVQEKEVSMFTIGDYDKKLSEILSSDKGFINRFKSCFPAQYLSAIITLIHDDIDDESMLGEAGYIFNISKGSMDLIRVDKKNPHAYVNIFSSAVTRDACLSIIKPFISKMYD